MLEFGDILFVRPDSMKGKLIARITNGPFSHVAMYAGNGRIIETDIFTKARCIKLSDAGYKDYDVMRISRLSVARRKRIAAYAMKLIGSKYDYKQILAILVRLLTGIRLSFLDDPHRFICTELIYSAYLSEGIDLLPGSPGHDISPEELRWCPIGKFITSEEE